jgi:hypothetical protein
MEFGAVQGEDTDRCDTPVSSDRGSEQPRAFPFTVRRVNLLGNEHFVRTAVRDIPVIEGWRSFRKCSTMQTALVPSMGCSLR